MADSACLGRVFAVLVGAGARAAGQTAVAFDPGGAARLTGGMGAVTACRGGRAVAVTDMAIQDVTAGEDDTARVAGMLGRRGAVVVGVPGQTGPGLVDLVALAAFEHAGRECIPENMLRYCAQLHAVGRCTFSSTTCVVIKVAGDKLYLEDRVWRIQTGHKSR